MAGITLAQAEEQLAKYIEAENKVLQAQSYSIAGRELTRANLSYIRESIEYWDRKVKDMSASSTGRSRGRVITPGW